MSSPKAVTTSHSFYTPEHLKMIRDHPQIISHLAGRTGHTQLHGDWIKYIWAGPPRPALMAHRGSYKSASIVISGAVWYLLFHPDARIFVVRKTYDAAVDAVSNIAKYFDIPEIRELFYFAHGEYPEFTIRREGRIEFSFKKIKTPEPSVMAFGLNSPFIGRHADFIIADDIATIDDKLSRATREFTKNMWLEISTNIIDRGKTCAYIGTPWHPDGVESLISEPKKFSVYDCGLISPEQLAEIKAGTTPSQFAANYELKFVSEEDALFKDMKIGKWRHEGATMVRAHVDAAYGAGDYCALTIGSYIDGNQIQMVGFLTKAHIKDWIDFIEQRMKQYKAKKIFVEKQSDRGMTAGLLRHAGLTVVEYDENLNKQHKISAYGYEVWPRVTWADDSDNDYLSQVMDWTPLSKEHDDAPDGFSSLARQCFSTKGPNSERWRW